MRRRKTGFLFTGALVLGIGTPVLQAAQPPITIDDEGIINSMEQQTMLIGDQRYNVHGAAIRTFTQRNGKTKSKMIARVSGSRPVHDLLPAGTHRVAFDLAAGSRQQIRTIWIRVRKIQESEDEKRE